MIRAIKSIAGIAIIAIAGAALAVALGLAVLLSPIERIR